MTLRSQALDSISEVVDPDRGWTPEWYGFVSRISRIGTVSDLPINRVDPVTGQPEKKVIVGERAIVTDSTAFTFGLPVVGGGTGTVPVYYDGTVWRIG